MAKRPLHRRSNRTDHGKTESDALLEKQRELGAHLLETKFQPKKADLTPGTGEQTFDDQFMQNEEKFREGYAGGLDPELYDPEKLYKEMEKPTVPKWMGTEKNWMAATLMGVRFNQVGRLVNAQGREVGPGTRLHESDGDYRMLKWNGTVFERLKEAENKFRKPFCRGNHALKEVRGGFFRDEKGKLREGFKEDDFDLGRDPSGTNALTTEYLPQMISPFYRQLYMHDFLEMHTKAYEAFNHSPVAHRAVELICQYTLGKRLKFIFKGGRRDKLKKVHETFWKSNRMNEYGKIWMKEAIIYGERIIRKYDTLYAGAQARSLDPASIWDFITDPEDTQTEYFAHQQYSTPYFLFYGVSDSEDPYFKALKDQVPDVGQTKYIVRQIPAEKYIHQKYNVVSVERRGRSFLFSILGYLKLAKDMIVAEATKLGLQANFIWDDTVEGTPADVKAHLAKVRVPPRVASVYAHTANIVRKPLIASSGYAGDSSRVLEDLLSFISSALGIPKEFLNVVAKGAGNRMSALLAGEPFTKVIDDLQADFEDMLRELYHWVFQVNGLDVEDEEFEIIFPSVTKDTSSERIKNLQTLWLDEVLDHQSFAEAAVSEVDWTSYNYEEMQKLIQKDKVKGLNPTEILGPGGMAAAGKSPGGDGGGGGLNAPGQPGLHDDGAGQLKQDLMSK